MRRFTPGGGGSSHQCPCSAPYGFLSGANAINSTLYRSVFPSPRGRAESVLRVGLTLDWQGCIIYNDITILEK